MKLASIAIDGEEAWGRVDEDRLVVLTDLSPTLRQAIAEGLLSKAADLDGPILPIADVVFRPVIPEPEKILCVGLNYEDHRLETKRPEASHPTIFTRFADSQSAHDGPILLPAISAQLDYEGELAVIIGTPCRSVSASDALSYVAGYSCYNDGSVRDWQNHTSQFTPGKNFPSTGAFGPWMVTPDEFGNPEKQILQTRLNGKVMQHTSIGDMIFPIPRLIEYCSAFTRLSPGDVIVTGTPGGVGFRRNPPVFMKEGDQVTVEIDRIGILSNTVMCA